MFWGAVALLVGTLALVASIGSRPRADPENTQQVALGQGVYAKHCAACHGAKLEGQPDWRHRLGNSRLPAPPHDATGHTWHHPDSVLFGITKEGFVPGKYAPDGYQSDMPAFGGALKDEEIWAVLAYIKSTWPPRERAYQRDVDRHSQRPR